MEKPTISCKRSLRKISLSQATQLMYIDPLFLVATTGRSWRERDVFIKTNFSYLGRSSLQKSFRSSKLSEALNYDKKQTSLTKSFI